MKKVGLLVGLVLFVLVSITLAADLTFTEGNNFKESGSFIVMGFVQNTSPYLLKDITITVKFYDKDGSFLRFGTASANPAILGPGEEANYQIMIPDDEQIASIKKTARWTVKEEN
jgi:hypothetical protein